MFISALAPKRPNQYTVSMSLTGCRYHKPVNSVRLEQSRKTQTLPHIDRAKHPLSVHPERSRKALRVNGDSTRQSYCNGVPERERVKASMMTGANNRLAPLFRQLDTGSLPVALLRLPACTAPSRVQCCRVLCEKRHCLGVMPENTFTYRQNCCT